MISRPASSFAGAELYKLLASLIVPRPIAFVSSLSAAGVANLAPFSFFMFLNDVPPIVGFSTGLRFAKDRKDTLVNIRETGEFVVNIVDEALAKPMNVTSLDWGPEVDEFAQAGIEAAHDNLFVRAPRVKAAPAQMECRLERLVEFPRYTLVAGEVLAFHYRDDVFDERLYVNYDRLGALGRLTGPDYCRIGDRFAMARAADSPDRHRR